MKTQQSTIDRIRTRPRFKIYTQLSPEDYEVNVKRYLLHNNQTFFGNINKEVATISVKSELDDYWKPCLALRTEIEDDQTVIRGIFGPTAAVWTFFMFLYFFFSIAWMTFFSLWFVETQIHSNNYPWALWASFVCLLCIGLIYLAARYGQKKAIREMAQLRRFAIESLMPLEKIDREKSTN